MIVDAVRLKLQLVVDIECAVEDIDLYWTFAIVGCGLILTLLLGTEIALRAAQYRQR